MADFELIAQSRAETGKGAMRRLRRSGNIPGVIYGGSDEPMSIQLAANYVRKQLENEAFYSHVLSVEVDGKPVQAVLKALQRHPSTNAITHLDLLRVSATQRITLQVPLHFENEDTSPGKRAGGAISHHITEVEVSCLPQDLPEYIAVDMSSLDIGQALHLSELVAPSGVELTGLGAGPEHDHPVVSIHAARDMEEPEEGVEGEEEESEGEAEE